ncbi:MAG: hypothetical protein JOZ43_09200 [Acidobacteriales bacterium]|nr:hypothetical protein [Terriglobales bacterium]
MTMLAVTENPMRRFPELKASNLEGRRLSLPQDFEGERNLVFIAFAREQQKDVDTWLREMPRFTSLDSSLRYYELPTISRLNAFSRWFIDNGMRRGIPDRNARARTITLYIDKQPFESALQIQTEKTIYALLLDRKGNVLWRTEGDFDETKAQELTAFLKPSGAK